MKARTNLTTLALPGARLPRWILGWKSSLVPQSFEIESAMSPNLRMIPTIDTVGRERASPKDKCGCADHVASQRSQTYLGAFLISFRAGVKTCISGSHRLSKSEKRKKPRRYW